jgi:hypothetical protein
VGFTIDLNFNPSSRTMTLGSTKPLTEMSTRNCLLSCVYIVCCLIVVPLPPGENPFAVNNNNKIFLGVKRGRHIKLANSPQSVSQLFRKCGILDISQPNGPPRPVAGINNFTFCITNMTELSEQ